MNIYTKKTIWKYALLFFAIIIGVSSLWYTNNLVQDLAKEESKRMKLLEEAINLNANNYDLTNETQEYLLKIMNFNETVPLILTNDSGKIISYSNIDSSKAIKDGYLTKKLENFKNDAEKRKLYTIRYKNKITFYLYASSESEYNDDSIYYADLINKKLIRYKKWRTIFSNDTVVYSEKIELANPLTIKIPKGPPEIANCKCDCGDYDFSIKKSVPLKGNKDKKEEYFYQYIYYDRSTILKQLTYYPYAQLGIIVIFILFAYFAFSSSRKAEQNQVWVGMSKETAHQLGTPISSLLAWQEIIRSKIRDPLLLSEFEKDTGRLQKITERFSKIGSKTLLKKENIKEVLFDAINYIKSRASNKTEFIVTFPEKEIVVPINISLFEWVVENICKNAIDAVDGAGIIEIILTEYPKIIQIDITDNGKGIPKRKFKTIFKPGFTTKERGWGLGLSLTKRIIEDYHNGKIFVHESTIGKGTTIRIILKNNIP